MYITNISKSGIPKERIFKTNETIATWLIESCKIPLLARSENGEFCFMITDDLMTYLKIVPYWFDITGNFS